jgi:formiminotetrahydrofolate cyclodeaminase
VLDDAEAIAHEAGLLRTQFLRLRPEDEAAYDAVVAAQALPRHTSDERSARTAALQTALAGAATVPLRVAHCGVDAFDLAERTAALRNEHLGSDVACAMHFARAVVDASGENVRINHRFLHDAALVAGQREELAALEARAAASEQRIRALLA